VAGVIAVAATPKGVVYEGAFGKANVATGAAMTLDTSVLATVDDQGLHRDGLHAVD
jgi:hypothetical protein